MSSTQVRSKTGCLTCKNRRKKCDEGRPVCERCTRAGIECLGYSYLDSLKRRTRRPKKGGELSGFASRNSASFYEPTSASQVFDLGDSTPSVSFHLSPVPLQQDLASDLDTMFASGLIDTYFNGAITAPVDTLELSSLDDATHSELDLNIWQDIGFSIQATPNEWAPLALPDIPTHSPFLASSMYDQLNSNSWNLDPEFLNNTLPANGSTCSQSMHSPTNTSISRSTTQTPASLTLPVLLDLQELARSSPHIDRDNESVTSEDSDAAADRETVYRTLALNSDIPSNSLPFVLESYSKWITYSVLEPCKLATQAKDFLLGRYTRSATARCVTTLKAHIVRSMIKNPALAVSHVPAIPLLRDSVISNIVSLKSKPITSYELDRQDALNALGDVMEIMSIHCLSRRLSDTLALIEAAAPIYRRACPEPPDELINLRASLLHPEVSVRHFPAMDILFSTRTCRPMCLRYDTTDMPQYFENLFEIGDTGLQWMQGMPDQFLVILAKINMLRENSASEVDGRTISELETELNIFRPIAASMTDPFVNVVGIGIQEAWRHALYVYIYMGLSGANNTDPRVAKALQRFIRLLEMIKSGRKPDEFLVLPMIIFGVAACRQRDRDIIKRRMGGLSECLQPGTCGFDSMQIMTEIWARADTEARPSVWEDLRIAASIVTGL
ncbi:hypothetical protein FRC12_012435 [Ceratobasidium sp. 428]|nr:hypothetical protein FRC12_012435 [Ceratobasidium sp. 428]